MAVVGVHEILLTPSLKGFQRAAGKELDGQAGHAGERAGRTMGSRLGGALRTGAVVAGAAAVAGIGTALTKGFGRLTQIENARAKLSGLGHEAGAVESIMNDALAAVKGTSFGMGDAATVAASAVAAGVKPGKDLQRTLKLTGDAATIAGVEMGEMGSIVNKVATSDMMQMDVANQLMDAGIPILQMVAEEMGVTAGEARDLASDGKVSFETFQAALEDGLGGAALKSGDTLQGAMKNAGAAVGRFGANLLEGVYPKLRTFFTAFQDWMGPVEEMGKVIGERLGTALEDLGKWITGTTMPALKEFGDWVRDNREPIEFVGTAVAGMMGAFAVYKGIQGVIGWIQGIAGAMGALSAAMSANPVGLIVVAVGALVGAVIWAYNNVEWFRDGVDEAFRVIGEVATNVWENFLRPAFEGIATFVRERLGPAFKWWYEEIVQPIMGFIGTTVKDAWELVIRPALGAFWRFIRDDLGPVVQSFWTNFVEPVFKDVQKIIQDTWTAVKPVLSEFKSFIESDLGPAFNRLTEGHVRPAMATVGLLIQGRMNRSKEQMGGLKSFMDNQLGPAFNLARLKARQSMEGIGSAIGGLIKMSAPLFRKFSGGMSAALVTGAANVVASFGRIWQSLKKTFQAPVNWVIRNVLNPLIDAFNKVSKAVNGPQIGRLVGLGEPATSRGNSAGTGGRTTVGRRAAGGNVHAGKPYLVGELGPELVYPDRDGYVATARETAKMMAAGQDIPEGLSRKAAGRNPSEALLPMGGGIGSLAGQGVQWLVGELAGSVRKLLDPALQAMSSKLSGYGAMGRMTGAAARKAMDAVLGFAKDKDAEFSGGAFEGDYTGSKSGFARPVGGSITSRFGRRWGGMHSGIDLAVPIGTAVRAAWNGVVQKASWNALTGRTGMGMVLGHGGGRQSYYGHLSGWNARAGQQVKAGQVIARSGNTGRSTGPHLHFEELRGGRAVNPGYLFRDKGGVLPPGLNAVLNNTGGNEWIFNQKQLGQLDHAVTGQGIDYDRLGDVLVDKMSTLHVKLDSRTTIGALSSSRAGQGRS